MAVSDLTPVFGASLFTLGCMGIHAFRRHAAQMTAVLTVAVFSLSLAVIVALQVRFGVDQPSFNYEYALLGVSAE
jgi:hypothetical protein